MSVDSRSLEAEYGRGREAQRAGDLATAHACYRSVLDHDPTHAPALRALASVLLREGAVVEAIDVSRRAVHGDAEHWRGHALLGEACARTGRLDQANASFDAALARRGDDADLLRAAAAARRDSGDGDAAIDLYKAALARKSSHQVALAEYALLLADRGDAKTAVARVAPSVNSGRAGPELLGTYALLLGRLGRRREGIALLERALQKTLPEPAAMGLHFTLAELLDGEGSYDLAFYHCQRGNNLTDVQFDCAAFNAHIDATVRTYTAKRLNAMPQVPRRGPRALIVVGLPGSGLLVLNRVLAQHPRIQALGSSAQIELSVRELWSRAGAQWPQAPAALDEHALAQAAVDSLAGRLEARDDAAFFLDGSWRNYLYLGVIARMFGELCIVECVRDARDIARSCYFRDVASGESLPFAYDLANLAAYVNGYRRLMEHWRQVLGVSIHRVSYERLVLDWRLECRHLFDHLAIDWQPDDFETSVRLDAKSLRRYRHYRSHLDRFVDALDAPPGDRL